MLQAYFDAYVTLCDILALMLRYAIYLALGKISDDKSTGCHSNSVYWHFLHRHN